MKYVIKTLNNFNERVINYLIIILFLLAFFTETYTGLIQIMGYKSFLLGGVFIFFGKYNIFGAWLSTLFFFCSFLLKENQTSLKLTLSGACVVFALMALTVNEIPINEGLNNVPVKVGIGLYFWIITCVLLFIKYLKKDLENKEYKKSKVFPYKK